MPLFILFILVPVIEIALFIQVGGLIGLWPTIGLVLLSAFLGMTLIRSQGRRALSDLQQSFQTLGDPTRPLAHGAMILLAGALLLTPGFFTDTIGLLLLIPGVRDWLMRRAGRHVTVTRQGFGFDSAREPRHGWPGRSANGDDVIEMDDPFTGDPSDHVTTVVDGGAGNDSIDVAPYVGKIIGGDGNDTIDYSEENVDWHLASSIDAGAGNDVIEADIEIGADNAAVTGIAFDADAKPF